MVWIKENLGPVIREALRESLGAPYTEDWLAAMAYREVHNVIERQLAKNPKTTLEEMAPLMKGDYGLRPGEKQKQYHGFGFWQIDTGSYKSFIDAGLWEDPLATAKKAILVLDEKSRYLWPRVSKVLSSDTYNRAITAAYNCGQGNVAKAVKAGLPVDHYTHNKDYSKAVWTYRNYYRTL